MPASFPDLRPSFLLLGLTHAPALVGLERGTFQKALGHAKLDARVLQRAFARTKFTTALDLEALKEYAALNVESGYARSVPDLSQFIRK